VPVSARAAGSPAKCALTQPWAHSWSGPERGRIPKDAAHKTVRTRNADSGCDSSCRVLPRAGAPAARPITAGPPAPRRPPRPHSGDIGGTAGRRNGEKATPITAPRSLPRTAHAASAPGLRLGVTGTARRPAKKATQPEGGKGSSIDFCSMTRSGQAAKIDLLHFVHCTPVFRDSPFVRVLFLSTPPLLAQTSQPAKVQSRLHLAHHPPCTKGNVVLTGSARWLASVLHPP
jgi:hypothetical protein